MGARRALRLGAFGLAALLSAAGPTAPSEAAAELSPALADPAVADPAVAEPAMAESAVVDVRAAALLTSGQEGGDLDFVALRLPGGGPVVIEVPPEVVERTPADDGAAPVDLEVFVYALGQRLEVLDAVTLSIPSSAFEARSGGPPSFERLRILAPVKSADGADLRILVRQGRRFGVGGVAESSAPASESTPAAVAAGTWLVVPRERPPEGDWLRAAVRLPPAAVAPSSSKFPSPSLPPRRPPQDLVPEEVAEGIAEIDRAYFDALRALGSPVAADAFGALVRREGEIYSQVGGALLVPLERQRGDAFDRLAEGASAPGDLLGTLLLQVDLALEHLAGGRRLLADRAASIGAGLAARYGSGGGEAEAREAAWALVVMADLLQRRGDTATAETLFRKAVDLDADDGAALLGLGAVLGKTGRPGEAVKPLARLVARYPDHAEGRLRLGVDLARLGRVDDAEPHLTALLPGEGWEARLAHQELARIEVGRGRGDRAQGIVRAGLERWPADRPLRYALARLLEQAGDLDAARRELSVAAGRSVATGAPGVEADRTRYNRWPSAEVEVRRQRLERAAEGRRGALAEAAGPVTSGDGVGGVAPAPGR
ncbi:MAG: tetratricopeptide repeat protein [Acidobacteriota bacterium]